MNDVSVDYRGARDGDAMVFRAADQRVASLPGWSRPRILWVLDGGTDPLNKASNWPFMRQKYSRVLVYDGGQWPLVDLRQKGGVTDCLNYIDGMVTYRA